MTNRDDGVSRVEECERPSERRRREGEELSRFFRRTIFVILLLLAP